MQIFNTIFGGGMISKLFMKVREEMSLCYDIHSSYHGSKGIIIVSAGIDCTMDARVRQEVMKQLQICQEGGFTAQELTAAKQALLNQLRSTHDSPGAIEGYYASWLPAKRAISPPRSCALPSNPCFLSCALPTIPPAPSRAIMPPLL